MTGYRRISHDTAGFKIELAIAGPYLGNFDGGGEADKHGQLRQIHGG